MIPEFLHNLGCVKAHMFCMRLSYFCHNLVVIAVSTRLLIWWIQRCRGQRVSLNIYIHSLNLYIFDQIFNFIFTCELRHLTKYFCLDLNKEIMNCFFFSGGYKSKKNCQWTKRYNKCLFKKCDIYLILEANITNWLIHWNIFPFLW